jgi:hypothetical protein
MTRRKSLDGAAVVQTKICERSCRAGKGPGKVALVFLLLLLLLVVLGASAHSQLACFVPSLLVLRDAIPDSVSLVASRPPCNLPERCYTTEIRDIFLNRQRFVDDALAGDPDLDAGRAPQKI